MRKINYLGSSKVISRICEVINSIIDAFPTKVSDLENDSGFITNTVSNLLNYYLKSETYTQAEVDALISGIVGMHFEVVQTLPVSDISTNTIYLVPSTDPQAQNVYDEYIYVNNAWEMIGTTAIDLTGYVTTAELTAALADYVTSTDFQTTLADYYTAADVDVLLAGKADNADIPTELSDLNDDTTHRLVTDTEKNTWNAKSDFSGSYNDLTDKPTIPAAQIQSDWNQSDNTALDYIKNKPTIPSVPVTSVNGQTGAVVLDADDVGALPDDTPLFSGDYDDLTNKPSIPSKTSDLQNDSGFISNIDNTTPTVTEASTRTNLAVGDTLKIIIGKIKKFFTDLKTVAFTGSYNDLTDKPSIPAAQVNSDWDASSGVEQILNKPTIPDELADLVEDSTHRTVTDVEKTAWNGKSDFSGDYDDLTNKPAIPSVSANPQTTTGTLNAIEIDGVSYAIQGGVTPLVGTTVNITPTQVRNALLAGTPLSISHTDNLYGTLVFNDFVDYQYAGFVFGMGGAPANQQGTEYNMFTLIGVYGDNQWVLTLNTFLDKTALSDDIPMYYNAEYATTKASVESHSTVASYNLLFMTDLHFSADGENYHPEQIRQPLFNTIKAAKKFVSEVPINQVVLGGDYMQFNSEDMTKEMGISNIAELNRMFDNVTSPIFLLSGNHEEHYNGGTGIGLTDDEIYQYLTKKWVGRDSVKKISIHTLYRIDEVNGVCHLFVTTNSSAETKTALFTDFASVVSANVNNYPYIVYNHFGNTDAVGNDVESNVKDCIDYIKTTLGKTIIAWISGHKHFDWVRVYNDTLVITILNSGLWTNEQGQDGETYSKTVGTATESAFTVLTVVPSTGKLFVTRFGSGVDFECNYNGTSGSVGRIGYIPPSTDYAVSLTLSGGVTASNTSSTASGSYSNTLIVPDSHFSIGTVIVTMGNVDITSSVYNAASHAINIASVTGDIAITATATNDYVVTLADVESVTQHDNYKPADYSIVGNSGGISTQYQSSGINAKASLKQAISSDTSFTLKADSVEPSGAGSNMGIAIRLKFWDSQGTVVKTVDYITSSNPSDLGALVQGITKNVTVSSLANATHIGFEIRTGSSATVPASIYVENLRLYKA